MHNLDDLKFVRVIDPDIFALVIPRYLFEQIKELDENMVDRIYKSATSIMTVPVVDEQGNVVGKLLKANVWIAALYDITNQVKGFIWATFDIVEQRIFVQACSVDKEYQSEDGEVMKKMVEYLRSLPISDEMKANIQMATIKPRAFERRGWTRTKNVLMEFKPDEKSEVTESDNKDS